MMYNKFKVGDVLINKEGWVVGIALSNPNFIVERCYIYVNDYKNIKYWRALIDDDEYVI